MSAPARISVVERMLIDPFADLRAASADWDAKADQLLADIRAVREGARAALARPVAAFEREAA